MHEDTGVGQSLARSVCEPDSDLLSLSLAYEDRAHARGRFVTHPRFARFIATWSNLQSSKEVFMYPDDQIRP